MNLVFGVVSVLCGLLGAYLAARAVDLGMLTFGVGLVGFAVLYGFWLIKDIFDQQEKVAKSAALAASPARDEAASPASRAA